MRFDRGVTVGGDDGGGEVCEAFFREKVRSAVGRFRRVIGRGGEGGAGLPYEGMRMEKYIKVPRKILQSLNTLSASENEIPLSASEDP